MTFTKGRSPEDVLVRYGADPQAARSLDHHASSQYGESLQEGAVLRAGILATWSFCLEEESVAGAMPATCSALSEGTETLSILRGGDGMNIFAHWRDKRCVEQFEPGMPNTKPQPPHPWWDLMHGQLATPPPQRSRLIPALEAVAVYIGAPLDSHSVDGPLLTARLSAQRTHSPSHPYTTDRRPPGRLLRRPGPNPSAPAQEGRALNNLSNGL
ncbi:DUF6461 domain-containing protein [Micromonospora sp. NPDC048839]|uniref:DUF6461 domain-containing protein n=1 Tax=Micromonospora sp. NPDC048839 TaxID=3155641 RepID=UPI0033D7B5E8